MSLATINAGLEDAVGSTGTIVENLAALTDSLDNTYTAIAEKGGTVPANRNTANLATAIEGIE